MNRQFDRQLFERMAFAVQSQHRGWESGYEFPATDEIVAQMNRESGDDKTRRLQSAHPKRLRHKRVSQCIERCQDPGLSYQIVKLSATTSSPLATHAADQRASV